MTPVSTKTMNVNERINDTDQLKNLILTINRYILTHVLDVITFIHPNNM